VSENKKIILVQKKSSYLNLSRLLSSKQAFFNTAHRKKYALKKISVTVDIDLLPCYTFLKLDKQNITYWCSENMRIYRTSDFIVGRKTKEINNYSKWDKRAGLYKGYIKVENK